MQELNSLETLALSKMVATKVAKAARADVEVGEHTGSVTVKVDWTLTVRDDTDEAGRIKVDDVLASLGRIAAAQYGEETAEDLLARLDESIQRRKAKRTPKKGACVVVAKITPLVVMAEGEVTPMTVETPLAAEEKAEAKTKA